MSTSCWYGCLAILLLLALLPSALSQETGSGAPKLNYSQCIHHRSTNTRKVLILTFNQSELIQPATATCAINCLAVNQSYEYILIHIPAASQFRDQLVCGCAFTDYAQRVSTKIPDTWCKLPCPTGRNYNPHPQHPTTNTSLNHQTCGDGKGLLSVYAIMHPSGSVPSQINPILLIAILFQCNLQPFDYLFS